MADETSQGHVDKLVGAGFDKVCVIDKSFTVKAVSAADAGPSAWNDEQGNLVNENQELVNNWEGSTSFKFWKKKYNVIQKSKVHLVASKGKDVVVAKEYKDIWIVAHGRTKGMGAKKGSKGKFANAAAAYNEACKELFDELDEDED